MGNCPCVEVIKKNKKDHENEINEIIKQTKESDDYFNKGNELILYLDEQNKRNIKNYKSIESIIKSKSFKKKLSDLENTLNIARKTYQ